ncbi:MAG: hypothetical protein WC516_02415 [Patescibacteria group bacterium]
MIQKIAKFKGDLKPIATLTGAPEQKIEAPIGLEGDNGVNTAAGAVKRRCLTVGDSDKIYFRRLFKGSITRNYIPLLFDFSRQLFREYGCLTASEKVLAQVAANAYVRILECSRSMEKSRVGIYLGGNTAGYYSVIGRELDRANRQFISALTALKQFKSPKLEINVTAKNAFMGNNQQFNSNK